MGFPRLPRYARNDSFGPAAHNNLLQRQDFLYDFHAVEHDPSTGEHNTPHVSRTLGRVAWSGAAYSLVGFNSDASLETGHNPAVGNVIITLPAGRYSQQLGVIEIQPADESGNGAAWIAHAAWVDDRHVSVFLKKDTSGGVQQVFAATDGDFFVGIRSPQLPISLARPAAATRRARGEGLRASSTAFNPFVQAMGDNRAAVVAAHASTGKHNVREVAKACGLIHWDGSAYSIRAHRGLEAGVTRVSTGYVRVHVTGASLDVASSVQAFVSPVSSATGAPTVATAQDGTPDETIAPEGLRLAVVPSDTCTGYSVDVFLYEAWINSNLAFSPPQLTYRWRAVDCDFAIRVHGA